MTTNVQIAPVEAASASPLEDQIRECYGRSAYSHKTHEKMADLCMGNLRRLKWGQLILTGLSSGSVLGLFLHDTICLKGAAALLSLGTFYLASYGKSFDPGGTAQKHRESATAIWSIREHYLSLLTDLRSEAITVDEARKTRNSLQGKLEMIYKNAPRTNSKAYKAAQNALQLNEELTFSDAEIDAMLPPSLRKGGRL